jgi:hypothetical protein
MKPPPQAAAGRDQQWKHEQRRDGRQEDLRGEHRRREADAPASAQSRPEHRHGEEQRAIR